MEEITVTMIRNLWVDVLIDLDTLTDSEVLEPGSHQLQRELDYKGVNL